MIDKTPAPKEKRAPLPGFAPVPRRNARHDGWTPERQLGFIEALADTGSVKSAAHAVNMTPEGAYQLRRHPEAGEFRKAWEAALKLGVQRLEDVAMERAIHGVEVPVYSYGKLVGSRRVYNDRLAMFMLRNRAGKRFSADAAHRTDASTRGQLLKLKKQWRKEWERERAMKEIADNRAAGDNFVDAIRLRHLRWWTRLSPRARLAYIEFRRIESAERHLDEGDEDIDRDQVDDYKQAFADDGRAPVDHLIEADGLADEDVLGEDLPADPPHGRLIVLKGDTWDFRRDGNDGRCTPI